jgi:putative ABC transport system permease protein
MRIGKLNQTHTVAEEARLMTTEPIHALTLDFRHALRSMRRGRAFTTFSVLTLALGIGATTAIFSIVNGVLIQPLRFPQPESLLSVSHTAVFRGVRIDTFSFNSQMAVAYLDNNRTFQNFGVWTTESATVTGGGEPQRVQTVVATHGVLPALGVQPALGRLFSLADDSPASVETAILTHSFWQRRFGGDPNVIGRAVTIDSRPRIVVGVMPDSFDFLDIAPDVILPKRFDRNQLALAGFGNRGVARLKPGVTLAQANADVSRMVRIWLDSLGPEKAAMEALQIGPAARPLKQSVVGDVGRVLWVLMGTIGMVLLIACANVANLLLVRAEGRRRELAIRAALGAGWARIARGLLVESLTLGLAGGVVGVGLAFAALRLLTALAPANLPRLNEITIDTLVLLFALAVSLLSGLLFGIVPVLKHAGPRIATVLHSAGRSGSQSREQQRSQRALVVVQVALALILLVGSGLMIRSFQAIRSVEPGFARPEQVQTVRI